MMETSMKKLSFVFIGALLALGCGDDDAGTDDTTDTTVMDDAGVETDQGMVATNLPSCLDEAPGRGGTIPGSEMGDFTLQTCDGEEYSFYNEAFCESQATVISIAAGWCPPCIAESMQLEEEITSVYGPQGVRVIQILIQTDDYSAPDLAYCQGWVDRFGLDSNVELIDPAQVTNRFFPDGALPSTIVVDSEGIIRFRENGASDGLTTLKAAIDQVLGS
tara:strand:+ start:438 stop:1094 length:657 start_codon:yes stop_codon:yes gene_type:complete